MTEDDKQSTACASPDRTETNQPRIKRKRRCGCVAALAPFVLFAPLLTQAPLLDAMQIEGKRRASLEKYYTTRDKLPRAGKRFRDLKRQNAWLIANCFDQQSGDVKYCPSCIMRVFSIDESRLYRLKRIASNAPADS